VKTHNNTKGLVRAWDVRTGKLLWTFNTIPKPGEFGNETWLNDSLKENGNTGVWTQISVDPDRLLLDAHPTNNLWKREFRWHLTPFFTRPICIAFATVTLFTILLYVPAFRAAVDRMRGAAGSGIKALFARRDG
jgi:hypothetical protein